MSSTANLRSRRSAAQLHALAGVEREIRVQDSHNRRKYLREFNQAFRSYESLLDAQQLRSTLNSADIILIGDYHALPAAQRQAATLIEQRALVGDRPVVLGVETIFARDQHILDEWWRREIDETELRQRIRFDLDWGYDWAPVPRIPGDGARPCRGALWARLHAAREICARSARATGTPPSNLPRFASAIRMRSSLCCSANHTSLPDTCRASCNSRCLRQRFLRFCKTSMRSTGGLPGNGPIKSKPYA